MKSTIQTRGTVFPYRKLTLAVAVVGRALALKPPEIIVYARVVDRPGRVLRDIESIAAIPGPALTTAMVVRTNELVLGVNDKAY